MIRCITNTYQSSSYNANYIELSNGMQLDMYVQHQRSNGETGKSYCFYITRNGSAAPVLPTARNTAAWEEEIAVDRLLPPVTHQRPELVDVVLGKKGQHRHFIVVQQR